VQLAAQIDVAQAPVALFKKYDVLQAVQIAHDTDPVTQFVRFPYNDPLQTPFDHILNPEAHVTHKTPAVVPHVEQFD